MSTPPDRQPAADATAPPALPVLCSEVLFGTQRELVIQHGAECYRLRITSSNKLILTK